MELDTAIILAGGFGTRLRPLTNDIPKPLLPIKGKPIIEHGINSLRKYGIKNIILSVGYKAEKIKEYFGDGSKFGVNISYMVEETPLGTGGAIKLASKDLTKTFLALNGDNLADYDFKLMFEAHKKNNAKITLTLFPVEDVTKFGIAELLGEKIISFIEKPTVEEAPTNLNNAGAYLIEPGVLDILPEGESSIEYDCFEKLCGPDGSVYCYTHKSQWFPTDDIEKYTYADNNFNPIE